MSWQILISLSIVSLAFYVIAHRWALRDGKYNPISFGISAQFIAGFTSLLVAIITGNLDLNYSSLPLLALLVSLAAASVNLLFVTKSLSLIDSAEFTIITNMRVFIMIGLSAIFLDDEITGNMIIGTLIILLATYLVVYKKGLKIHFGKGELYAVLATITIGIPFASDTYSLQDGFDPASYLAFIWTAPMIVVASVKRKETKKIISYIKFKDFWMKVIPGGALLSLGIIALLSAFQAGDNPSLLAIISQTSSILVVILSIFLLKERSHLLRKLIAVSIAFSGLVLINI